MKIAFEFAGGQDIARVLNQMGESCRRETMLTALAAAAQPVAAQAAALCRRGTRGDPHLADNIGVRVLPARGEFNEASVSIGPPKEFFYDYFLEYGTSRSRAFPFYRPALDQQVPHALVICRGTFWTAIVAYASTQQGGTP